MKEAANSLLKVLEEPPEFATIFLLSENAGELLPTIRSRSMAFTLCALSVEEVERDLTRHHPEWKTAQRALVARLSGGALGRARSFDLDSYIAARTDALTILNSALLSGDHSALFKITESYRPGAEGREKMEYLLRTLYSLLRDLMFLTSGAPPWFRIRISKANLRSWPRLPTSTGSARRPTASLTWNAACAATFSAPYRSTLSGWLWRRAG